MESRSLKCIILSFVMFTAVFASVIDGGTPDISRKAVTYMAGDWVVSGSENRVDEIIVLSGNLIITGSLSLTNVTLMMNCTADGQYRIEVQSGGSLYLNDTDGNRSTKTDAANVTNGLTPGCGYLFSAEPGAIFEAHNSNIEKCGLLTGVAGAATSGLTLSSNFSVLNGTEIRSSANGVVIDSCDAVLSNCSVTANQFNGVYLAGISDSSHKFNVSISNCNISGNGKTGILANANYIGMAIFGNRITGNMANGTMLVGGIFANATIIGNTVSSNKGLAGIGAMGSTQAVLNLDVLDNSVVNNSGTSLKFGILAKLGTMLFEKPVRSVNLNLSGNTANHSTDTGSGIMFIYASESIWANITGNDFLAPRMTNGIHIGCLSTDFNLGPATRTVSVAFTHNNLTSGSAGALRITSNGTLSVNMSYNNIYGMNSFMSCGGVYLGWFQEDFDFATARNATINVNNNSITNVAAGGGLWIDGIDNIYLKIADNTLAAVNGGAIKVGDIVIGIHPRLYGIISNNTVGSGSLSGIEVTYSQNVSVFSNTVTSRTGFYMNGYLPVALGDGIRVNSPSLFTRVFNNSVSNCYGSGVKLVGTRGVFLYNNTLATNFYGIGLDNYANKNSMHDNIITKSSTQYGYLISPNSLDHTFPSSNTVMGASFRYFRNLNGASGALLPIGDIDFQYPPLMSTLGQVVFADCSYLSISNVTAANGTTGLGLYNVDYSSITGNRASYNTAYPGYGIGFQLTSDSNAAYGNLLEGNQYGIGMADGIGNSLWSNAITKSIPTQSGFYINPTYPYYNNEITVNNSVNGAQIHYLLSGDSGTVLRNITVDEPNLMNLGQIVSIGTGDLTLENVSVSNGQYGLYIQDTVNVTVTDSEFLNSTYNILSLDSSGLSVKNSHINGGKSGLRMISATGSVRDSAILNASVANVNLTSSSSCRAINLTFDRAGTAVESGSRLDVEWYLDVSSNVAGRPLAGANVTLTDIGGATLIDQATDANGTIPRKEIAEYFQDGAGKNYSTPYYLSVTLEGYSSYQATLPMDENTFVNATLSDIAAPRFVSGPAIFPASPTTSSDILLLYATLDDSATGNSSIAAAQWMWAGTTPTTALSMLASDGTFSSQNENVTAAIDISALAADNYTIAVRGLDAGGNWCSWSNISFTLADDQGPSCVFKDSLPSTLGLSYSSQLINLTISDEDFGANAISGIEWRILDRLAGTNGSVSEAVTAQDGVLNQASEDVYFSLNFGDREAGLYSLFVRGMDSAGNYGSWAVWDFGLYDDMAPASPTSLWVLNTTVQGELKLLWAANTEEDLAGYNIFRTTVPGKDYELVASVGPDAITWSDSDLANDTLYFYVMTAFDDAATPNESPFSSEAGARTIRATENSAHTDSTAPELLPLALIVVIVLLTVIVLLLRHKRSRKMNPPGPPS